MSLVAVFQLSCLRQTFRAGSFGQLVLFQSGRVLQIEVWADLKARILGLQRGWAQLGVRHPVLASGLDVTQACQRLISLRERDLAGCPGACEQRRLSTPVSEVASKERC